MMMHNRGCMRTHQARITCKVSQTAHSARFRCITTRAAAGSEEIEEKSKPAPAQKYKLAWQAAEAFGVLIGQRQETKGTSLQEKAQISREEALQCIRNDFDVNYFVSGEGELAAYDANCRFADDFNAFNGVERFKANVSNLGALTEDVKLTTFDWEEGPSSMKAKWRFSSVLKLPWRPLLAASGATTYVFDEQTGLVVEHIEEWDIEPAKVFKQLLQPAKRPTDTSPAWERFMYNIAKGRIAEAWAVISARALVISGSLLGVLLILTAANGNSFPLGWFGGALTIGSGITFAAAAYSVVLQAVQERE